MGVCNSKENHLPPNNKSEETAEQNTSANEMKGTRGSDVISEKLEEVPEVAMNTTNETLWCDNDSNMFYKFVILHSERDIEEAIRIQAMLQNQFHIAPGIIFAEMPCGRHTLQNLEDAVNGSAWTIILLTENFLKETWCEYQTYTCLINSINKQHKYNSVIPLRPANNGLSRARTPLVLQAINALEEGAPAFAQQVETIFQETSYENQKEIWKKERWN
ncbi:TIR domain-containing adapter molecule 2 [Lissotriton helveticus]